MVGRIANLMTNPATLAAIGVGTGTAVGVGLMMNRALEGKAHEQMEELEGNLIDQKQIPIPPNVINHPMTAIPSQIPVVANPMQISPDIAMREYEANQKKRRVLEEKLQILNAQQGMYNQALGGGMYGGY